MPVGSAAPIPQSVVGRSNVFNPYTSGQSMIGQPYTGQSSSPIGQPYTCQASVYIPPTVTGGGSSSMRYTTSAYQSSINPVNNQSVTPSISTRASQGIRGIGGEGATVSTVDSISDNHITTKYYEQPLAAPPAPIQTPPTIVPTSSSIIPASKLAIEQNILGDLLKSALITETVTKGTQGKFAGYVNVVDAQGNIKRASTGEPIVKATYTGTSNQFSYGLSQSGKVISKNIDAAIQYRLGDKSASLDKILADVGAASTSQSSSTGATSGGISFGAASTSQSSSTGATSGGISFGAALSGRMQSMYNPKSSAVSPRDIVGKDTTLSYGMAMPDGSSRLVTTTTGLGGVTTVIKDIGVPSSYTVSTNTGTTTYTTTPISTETIFTPKQPFFAQDWVNIAKTTKYEPPSQIELMLTKQPSDTDVIAKWSSRHLPFGGLVGSAENVAIAIPQAAIGAGLYFAKGGEVTDAYRVISGNKVLPNVSSASARETSIERGDVIQTALLLAPYERIPVLGAALFGGKAAEIAGTVLSVGKVGGENIFRYGFGEGVRAGYAIGEKVVGVTEVSKGISYPFWSGLGGITKSEFKVISDIGSKETLSVVSGGVKLGGYAFGYTRAALTDVAAPASMSFKGLITTAGVGALFSAGGTIYQQYQAGKGYDVGAVAKSGAKGAFAFGVLYPATHGAGEFFTNRGERISNTPEWQTVSNPKETVSKASDVIKTTYTNVKVATSDVASSTYSNVKSSAKNIGDMFTTKVSEGKSLLDLSGNKNLDIVRGRDLDISTSRSMLDMSTRDVKTEGGKNIETYKGKENEVLTLKDIRDIINPDTHGYDEITIYKGGGGIKTTDKSDITSYDKRDDKVTTYTQKVDDETKNDNTKNTGDVLKGDFGLPVIPPISFGVPSISSGKGGGGDSGRGGKMGITGKVINLLDVERTIERIKFK